MNIIIAIDILLFIYIVKMFYDMYRKLRQIRQTPELRDWFAQKAETAHHQGKKNN